MVCGKSNEQSTGFMETLTLPENFIEHFSMTLISNIEGIEGSPALALVGNDHYQTITGKNDTTFKEIHPSL